MFNAAGTKSRLVRRLLTASFVDVSPLLRDVSRTVLFAAALTSGALGFAVSDANAQVFKNSSVPNGPTANQTPPERAKLFSGKLMRNFTESTSNRDAQTPNNANINARANANANAARSNARHSAPAQHSGPGMAPANAPRGSYLSPNAASQATSVESLTQATTDRALGREIAAKIPWNALSPEARKKLQSLTTNPTLYRRLPMAGGHCNPELFDFLLCRPHTVVAFWNQMGYDDLSMRAKGPYRYELREKTGTVASVQILYQDSELSLIYCNGIYRSPLVARPLEGEMLLVLQTRYTEDDARRPVVVCRLDSFVDLKNAGADLLARTFAGSLGKIADANFEQTVAFIDSLSQTAETNPSELIASVLQLRELAPEDRRLLAAKTTEIARQARLRAQGEVVHYRTLPKKNLPNETFARILSRESNGGSVHPSQLAARPHSSINPMGNAPSATRSGSIYAPPTQRSTAENAAPRFDEFETVSLENNSFALANDLEGTSSAKTAYQRSNDDFESTIDWEDDNKSDADAGAKRPSGGLNALKPATSATSTAKAVAKTTPKYSEALNLLEADEVPGADERVASAPTTLATKDDSNLLADFEAELAAGESDAETSRADVAIPFFETETTAPTTNGSVGTRRSALPIFNAKPVPLKTTDAGTNNRANQESSVAPLEAEPLGGETLGDAPVLYLPDIADESAETSDDAPELVVETEATEADVATPKPSVESKASETTSGAGVWRAVKITQSTKKTEAESLRVDKTAKVETDDGVSFRKPILK